MPYYEKYLKYKKNIKRLANLVVVCVRKTSARLYLSPVKKKC